MRGDAGGERVERVEALRPTAAPSPLPSPRGGEGEEGPFGRRAIAVIVAAAAVSFAVGLALSILGR